MDKLTALIYKIDNLSIRERAAVLLGILAVLYTGWNTLLMQPLENQRKIITSELQQKQATQVGLNMQIQKIIEDGRKDPNLENQEKLAALKSEIMKIKETIQASTAHLVSPKNMAKILETVLHKTKGLDLVEIKGLGVNPLIDKAGIEQIQETEGQKEENEKPSDTNMGNAYKHGLKIEFEGDYMATLDYLRELESLEWKFFWDRFELEVKEYPQSRATIQVFTLSLDKNWIDV
ncbi:MAG: hypothetical protein HW411_1626 [Gammaproteobacteria bacterium]|nr:hypothetical protein [Gammaproteobacteria bacterium]